MTVFPNTSDSDFKAVAAAAVSFDTTMVAEGIYQFSTSTACYIAQGAAPTASGADGSMLVNPGQIVLINGALGAKLSVVRVAADGVATLTRVMVGR